MLNLSPLTNFKKLDSNFCINWNLAHILIFNPYKINNNFGTTGHRRKIQKAKLVRIKFPIELSNFYLSKTFFCIEVFLPHQVLVKLKKATAKLNPSGFGSAQLSLLLVFLVLVPLLLTQNLYCSCSQQLISKWKRLALITAPSIKKHFFWQLGSY